MSPEYGATCAIFPIDRVTLDYLAFTGRPKDQLELVETYAKAQGLWHDAQATEPTYSEYVELDLSSVEPSLAGPKRPQDRVSLSGARGAFRDALGREPKDVRGIDAAEHLERWCGRRGGDHVVHEHVQPLGLGRRRTRRQARGRTRTRKAVGEEQLVFFFFFFMLCICFAQVHTELITSQEHIHCPNRNSTAS